MDYILSKLENKIMLEEKGSYDYITLLRARVEYCLFFCLGYLWKNIGRIDQDERNEIFQNLNRLSIGSVVADIYKLDIDNEIFISKKKKSVLEHYPSIRNSKIGHGYDMASDVASSLRPLYDELLEAIPLLKARTDIIFVKNFDASAQRYKGVRLGHDKNGEGELWSCTAQCFGHDESSFPRVYALINDKYFKISPFIHISDRKFDAPYVFDSLDEKITGKTKVNLLFHGDEMKRSLILDFGELVYLFEKKDEYRLYSQSNGTIMNYVVEMQPQPQYIEVGILKRLVNDFLVTNKAYVTATIWGHGGVGKTACIKRICYDLFNNVEKQFSYIVFITAKDRAFDSETGRIVNLERNVRLYSEVIETISRTIFNIHESMHDNTTLLLDIEKRISAFEERLLLIIDDYETFEDSEKQKISRFLSTLNAQYHKVIVTTRNKRLVIGEPIPCSEFDILLTKQFIEESIKREYSDHLSSIQALLLDENKLRSIHLATSGRPIFIYQFIHIFIQRGFRESLIEGIRTSGEAREFLYGRIFEQLSSSSQIIFGTISALVDEDLRFSVNILEYVLERIITDKEQLDSALEDIADQKIIERINDSICRVYSNEVLTIMEKHYLVFQQDIRSTILNRLDSIGGKSIEGDVQQAMLNQADKSRVSGNEIETVDRYRRVLNYSKGTYDIKKNALRHLGDYLSNTRLNPQAAIKAVEDYLGSFSDDPDLYSYYVFLLWSQKESDKTKAVKIIREFFSREDKTSDKNLTFFALGTGYCIDYDIQYNKDFQNDMQRRIQFLKTFNEYSRVLFEYIKRTSCLKGKPAMLHNINVALIQTLKLCLVLSKLSNKDSDRVRYGLEICEWLQHSNLNINYQNQLAKLRSDLGKAMAGKELQANEKAIETLPNTETTEPDTDGAEVLSIICSKGQLSVNSVIQVKVTHILSYGVFVEIDKLINGLIHISEIANRFVEDIFREFVVGDLCWARIISIENGGKRIGLSTKEFR